VIEATISTIAKRGLARLTLTDVARAAGISHGLVLFHFQSKENLLAETLAYLADEYQANWQAALADAGEGAAGQLRTLLDAEFRTQINTSDRLAAWCAFWGEAQSRPVYQDICGDRDDTYIRQLEEICATLVKEGGYPIDPVHAARILRLVVEGSWLDMMTQKRPYAPDEARATVEAVLTSVFGKHFPE
jgi:TetR/AcrR family transcriptional regulator, transcriptional repressor of bet genes